MQQPTPPQMPAEPVSSASSSAGSPWIPYSTSKHRVTKGRYITSNDPRGYIPVYEYPLNNQWVMMDVDDGYVLWTGIWKALGNAKADIVKMIESQPELESQLRRVRGGYLKIQGTWMPYEVALRLARRVAWPIRHDLVPLFGPTFPSTCLSPDQPGYGQVLDNAGRRRKRGPNAAARAAAAALRNQQLHPRGGYADYRGHPYPPYYGAGPYGAPHDEYAGYPPRVPPYGYEGGPQYGPPGSPYGPPPGDGYAYPPYGGAPPPHGRGGYPPPGDYPYPPPGRSEVPQPGPPPSGVGFSRRTPVDSRARYASYPAPVSPNQQSYPLPPPGTGYPPASADGPLDLPPISSIALGTHAQRDGTQGQAPTRPMLERSLPPIEGMSREGAGMPPSMDTAAVLRRLRIEDISNGTSGSGDNSPQGDAPPSRLAALKPMGMGRGLGAPSDEYLQTRRRSSSAPPIPMGLGAYPDYERERERAYARRGEMMPPPPGEYAVRSGTPPGRYSYPSASGGAGPARNTYHRQHHDHHHHPYAAGPPPGTGTSAASSSSSRWQSQIDHDVPPPHLAGTSGDEPISPISSAPHPQINQHTLSMQSHYASAREAEEPLDSEVYAHHRQQEHPYFHQRHPPEYRGPPPSAPQQQAQPPPSAIRVAAPRPQAAFVGIQYQSEIYTRNPRDDDEDMEDAVESAGHSSFVRGEGISSPNSLRPIERTHENELGSSRRSGSPVSSGARRRNSNDDRGDGGGGGLQALARAAASASASAASATSASPPHHARSSSGEYRDAIQNGQASHGKKPSSASSVLYDTNQSPKENRANENGSALISSSRSPVRPW